MNYTIKLYHIRNINVNMSETTEGRERCRIFCTCVEDNKHIFKDKVLMNRIHKCRIVDILTESQKNEIYERIRIKQSETYNKYMENKR